jgi:hypothetical protein
MGDAVFHIADKSMEAGLRAFFQRPDWHALLGCARFQIDPVSTDDIFRVPRYKDGGVWKYAATNLANHLGRYDRAIVILDEHFDPYPGAAKIRADIEQNMCDAHWPADNFSVIVIQPMLEAWLWADDASTAAAFGVADFPALRAQLVDEGYWTGGEPKPHDMKGARDRAVTIGGRITSNVLFQTVFGQLTGGALDHCVEPGFARLRQALRTWFPPGGGNS